ncbi:ras-related protein Rab-21-like isoform X2 [Leptotrombidium deliense]|uniref:Ras-related protein Rab-21-like isoform X2 n=1 Tax=Leptotrombidium deliense TaxID=299467 RepID=A0A443SHY0_9ACAR|nr:ras-related protein Rab-21-like isoform X2 [Leptotrombidium deliense]
MRFDKIEAKVVVIGAQNVGKTSVSLRYIGQKFGRQLSPTVGASFLTNTIHLNGTEVKLMIWDTAGQERFKSMTPMYYRNANAAIIVFDLSCDTSFILSKKWAKGEYLYFVRIINCFSDLLRNIDYSITLCYVGNKCDLKYERKVSSEEAEEYAESINAKYFETSALTNEGISEVFLHIAKCLVAKSDDLTRTRKNSIHMEHEIKEPSMTAQQSSCC